MVNSSTYWGEFGVKTIERLWTNKALGEPCAYSVKCPRKPRFCLQIFISRTAWQAQNFYYTGEDMQALNNQSASLPLLAELWEHIWLRRRSYFWPLGAGKYLVCILSTHTHAYNRKPYMFYFMRLSCLVGNSYHTLGCHKAVQAEGS